MKSAKEILQNKFKDKVIFSFSGKIISERGLLNANELVEAMEEYAVQYREEKTKEENSFRDMRYDNDGNYVV